MPRRAILRFDLSSEIGAGHAMRTLALGRALRDLGVECMVALGPRSDMAGFPEDSIAVRHLPDDSSAGLRSAFPEGCDILVIDSYSLGSKFQSECRNWAGKIVALDDAPVRQHDCDVLVDATPGRTSDDYAGLVPPSALICAGADYAPLRPEFLRVRHEPREACGGRVLVGFGASDPGNFSEPAIDVVRAAGLTARVIIGRLAPHGKALRERYEADPQVELRISPVNVAAEMAECAMAVGAAGVSALERCCLALASVVVPIVRNQHDNANALDRLGAAIRLGAEGPLDLMSRLPAALARLCTEQEEISHRAAEICDGYGAIRIAAAAGGLSTRDGRIVTMRPVRASDSAAILAWQRAPEVRRYARNPDPPTTEGHTRWFGERLSDPMRLFEIAQVGGQAAGVIRLDRRRSRDAGTLPCYEVSIYTVPGMTGIGVGKAMLAYARAALPWARLEAEVLRGNEASHALFTAAGFVRHGDRYDCEPIWKSS
ncbi:MAG: UDP-2,4-diacetamido-2,4,6-trideoxy-beta-L-altropyranose hydrolase [Rhodospirillales bacterium]|nr:UDP-2,4-diacetamido-2,4,6-trideoxy-beta-L-altropyranose hydrolase [Rhodospirillales bacterium]